MEIIAGSDSGLHFDRSGVTVFIDFDEGREEIQNTVPQLLNIGMLVGRALVAVHGDALVHGVALQVELGSVTGAQKPLAACIEPIRAAQMRARYCQCAQAAIDGVFKGQAATSTR